MICEPYRVAKALVVDHLEYRVWYLDELIGECKSWEECQIIADKHALSVDRKDQSSDSVERVG